MATIKLVTINDLAGFSDDDRYDLIRGELIRMPPASGPHGKLAAGLIARLWIHVNSQQLGEVYSSETGFVLARDPDVLLAPDAAFISTDRVPPEDQQRGFYEMAPDLVVEVISPGDRARYVNDKVMEYLSAGVLLVWIADPVQRTVTVYQQDRTARILTVEDTIDGGDVLPGFELAVADIFS